MSDHDRIIMLESERDELKLKNADLAHQVIDLALHGETWSKLLKHLPVSVFEDMAFLLEYGQGAHKPDEWKGRTIAFHLGRAYKHFEDYLRGETIDKDTGKSVLNNIIIRVCMAAALEKENGKA